MEVGGGGAECGQRGLECGLRLREICCVLCATQSAARLSSSLSALSSPKEDISCALHGASEPPRGAGENSSKRRLAMAVTSESAWCVGLPYRKW